jgi:hypothetical protein
MLQSSLRANREHRRGHIGQARHDARPQRNRQCGRTQVHASGAQIVLTRAGPQPVLAVGGGIGSSGLLAVISLSPSACPARSASSSPGRGRGTTPSDSCTAPGVPAASRGRRRLLGEPGLTPSPGPPGLTWDFAGGRPVSTQTQVRPGVGDLQSADRGVPAISGTRRAVAGWRGLALAFGGCQTLGDQSL